MSRSKGFLGRVAACGFAIIGSSLWSSPANATALALWTFETSIPVTAGPHLAESGFYAASSAMGAHASPTAVYSNPVGNGSLESFSSNMWFPGDFYQFTTSTAGFSGIRMTWDQTRSGTGPLAFILEYSVDNGFSFATSGSYALLPINWTSGIFNPASSFDSALLGGLPPVVDNQMSVVFRLTALAPGTSPAGTSRIDNVLIEGTEIPAVPEPAPWLLLGAGGLILLWRRFV